MNGVISASVSAGSSQRVASVTWAANVMVPAGCAAAGPARSTRSDRPRIARAAWDIAGSIARCARWIGHPFRTAGHTVGSTPRDMSLTGLDVFDRTVHTTNRWLEETADLAAQLPMLVRGLYYEGWADRQAGGRAE